MSDQAKRPTLSLGKKKTEARSVAPSERVRSGPRAARRAAQIARQHTDTPPVERPSSDTQATRSASSPSKARKNPYPPAERPDARAPRAERPVSSRFNHSPDASAQRPGAPRQTRNLFRVFAPCPQGLEDVLYNELEALGFTHVKLGRAGCHFGADWAGVLKANLYSRIATRILVQVAYAKVHHEDDIYELALNTRWEDWFGPDDTLRVDTSAVRSPMQSLQFCNLRAKDGVCDRLRRVAGARPDIDTVRPDAKVHVFLDQDSATLYLDTSGESLFKRGWRHHKGEAPLRENLAAGVLALAGWDPNAPLMDSFCGSGTILIEAAWIALGAPPGIWRPFHFERLRNHNPRLWQDLKAEAREHIAPRLEAPLVGYDLNPNVIEAAKLNLERAHLTSDTIRFEVGDALQVKPIAEQGYLVSNPPYGERLDAANIEFWRDWSANLKANFSDWQISLISSDLELPKHLRLKPKQRIPLYNGALECRLFNFEMVADSYRER
ncbi:MAG TPA: class I SAM-dependent RNA methyltransferase [Candidatus Paenalcaligenes intestinipullorum]|uniref:Class I SAM-dependent RNA methyltransferase n=1 Tax=Candidatus Paenalcaligenes intestinipullorum TaxID=2838718 RepID=A0A9D2RHR6_9BURK|nr:class I SAM-dependent RNA methyltransferase [Candidatus Paenalcaligenes intestinipullorum]